MGVWNEIHAKAVAEGKEAKRDKVEHIYYVCPGDHKDSYNCHFCDGDLSACATCNAFEGAWPDDCPGTRMDPDQSDDVYAGRKNYRDGEWRDECCQVMRHIYDLDNLMAESGYVKDGLNTAGNTKWKKLPVAEWVKPIG
jgi:hypothetical protein